MIQVTTHKYFDIIFFPTLQENTRINIFINFQGRDISIEITLSTELDLYGMS